ncbi:MAG: hypothetical protein H6714_10910 [Myxococcales bacterium]|nr:hypothetical protein [Myxococcales bacterium]
MGFSGAQTGGMALGVCGMLLAFGCASAQSDIHAWETSSKRHTPLLPASRELADMGTHEAFAPSPKEGFVDPVSEAGQMARGLYVTGPFMRRMRNPAPLLQQLKRTASNAVVIDMKDDQGRVFFETAIEELRPQQSRPYKTMPELVRRLREKGVYIIGRLVCFSDPVLPRKHPERAVLDARPHKHGAPWVSWGNGSTWLDPYNRANHQLIVRMAKEIAALGVDELQLDYIRFPVDPGTRIAMFPHASSEPRREVLRELLREIDLAIPLPISVDVFGLTAFREGDPTGLGQSLEDWTEYVEIFSPMLYINNMKSWGRHLDQRRAFALVNAGIHRLRERLGPGPVLRPFLQAFSAGADYFNTGFIEEQVAAARSGGADGYLFWHPASNYGTVARTMRRKSSREPFIATRRQEWRQRLWSPELARR